MSHLSRGFIRAVAELGGAPGRTAAELDHLLDEALGDTFPASDPVSDLRVSAPGIDM